jgi:hypothetical protein
VGGYGIEEKCVKSVGRKTWKKEAICMAYAQVRAAELKYILKKREGEMWDGFVWLLRELLATQH